MMLLRALLTLVTGLPAPPTNSRSPSTATAPPTLAPGQSTSITWPLKAGDLGTFALYIVLLPVSPQPTTMTPSAPTLIQTLAATPRPTKTLLFVLTIPVLRGSATALARWQSRHLRH